MTDDPVNEHETEAEKQGDVASTGGGDGDGGKAAGAVTVKELPADSASHPNRRKAIVGAGVGAVVVAAGAYGLSRLVQEPAAKEIDVAYTGGESVPLDDPNSDLWSKAASAKAVLGPQNVATPMLNETLIGALSVRALHDGGTIGFLLEWGVEEESDLTIETDQFRDGCAVLFAPKAQDSFRMMGMPGPGNAVTIVQWKADWQRDVDKGFQDITVAFPNASTDFYPPLIRDAHNAVDITVPDAYISAQATYRLSGYAVDNFQSAIDRVAPVEKIFAQGAGTVTTAATQDASGSGLWTGNGWRVALGKNMQGADPEELSLEAGKTYGVAFAAWLGADDNAGARKNPSPNVLKLNIEAVAQ
ncbi:MAG: hypothetical protein IT198_14420 [Acidimicrobiia bacterium]|nr:hypothetical protein [Acidimicrobiia bacterium]